MAFTIDYSQAQQGFTLVDPGQYECVIMEVKPTTAKSGTQGFVLSIKVRDDVQQKAAGAEFEQTLWTKKATGQLPGGLLNAMAKAIKLPNGKQYNSALELFGDMVFKPFLGEITIDEQEYGEDKKIWRSNRIVKWHETKYPNLTMSQLGYHPIDNNDVPF